MIFLGQDKGRGPKWPKPLSAHLFSRDARGLGRDAVFAQCAKKANEKIRICLLYTSPSPRDATLSRMPSSA